jgi:tetratricopeptide (TPR) repeat protein
MDALETLIRFIQNRKPVVWIGAGLSIDAGYPTVGQLADLLWEKHSFDPKPQKQDPYELIDAYYEKYRSGDLSEALSKLIPLGVSARPAHHALARLAKANSFSNVITTNYDRLVDNAFAEQDVNYLLQVMDRNQSIREDGRLRLYKIHGDVGDWEKVILTGDSYRTFTERYQFLSGQFDILLKQNPLLFIGCSMLDDRVLDWVEALPSESTDSIHSWVAILTAAQQETLKQHKCPSGVSAWQVLQKIRLRVLDLPDFATLPMWLDTAAQEITGSDTHQIARHDTQRPELILNIPTTQNVADENWSVTLDGRVVVQPANPLQEETFVEKLEQLEALIHLPLPCDAKGNVGAKETAAEAAIHEYATDIGTHLAAVFDEQGRQALVEAMQGSTIPLLRIIVDGDGADRVLALPWELLYLDGRFPVKEARLDIVREVSVPNALGLEPQTAAFKVLVHIAAPEDDAGQGALMYEEEAYRLVLSMQQAAEGAVVFSDLGSVKDLIRAVRRVNPSVVHFTGHGGPGILLFENDSGDQEEVNVSDLLAGMRASAVEGQSVLPQVFYLASCYGASGTSAALPAPTGYKQLSELGAVKGEGPSTATTLQREGCPAVLAYFGPVGDHLSTHAEATFYGGLAAGKRLTESVRTARRAMTGVLGEEGQYYRYPLGWAQLALYLRGSDEPLTDGDVTNDDVYALEQELYRLDSPVQSLDVLRSGVDSFIGRRKAMAILRQRHRKGQRVFVLHGLGGIGKTALAINLIPKLGAGSEKVVLLDAARADKTDDPVQDLWQQMTDQLQKTFPGPLAAVLDAHKEEQDPHTLLAAVIVAIAAVKSPWLIYLDNAESLQTKVESDSGELGAWASEDMAEWWRIAAAGAVRNGDLTLMATTRFLWAGLNPRDSWPVAVLRPADIARMLRWFPFLRKMPQEHKKIIVEWLNGHARALIYLEGLLKEILDSLTPEDAIAADRWQSAIDEALPNTQTKLVNEDLMLTYIWQRLDAPSRKHLQALTALRRPVPLDAVKALGDQTGRLESLGLLTRFPGEFRGMHATVHRFVETHGSPAESEDHSCLGHWYKGAYEADRQLILAEEAVYYLVAAEEADSAASPAVAVASRYRQNLRYAEAMHILDSVIALSPAADELEPLLQIRGNLYHDLGQYESSATDFQAITASASKRESSGVREANGLHGLANAFESLGRYEEAVEAYRKSLEIDKEV